jgi:sulfite reductase (NADPH) flavoprotein alpha-component
MASVNAAWAGLNRAHIDRFEEVTIMLPNGGGPVRMRGLLQGARHERMTDDIEVAGDGTVGKVDRYADRPLGKILIASILPVHQGSFFGLPGRIVMTLTSATMPLFAITGILLYLGRRKRKRALAALQPLADPAVTPADALLIAYASQTGRAQQLARQTAIAFEATGHPVRVLSLGDVGPQELAEAPRALFVASTYGDGEPPDEARAFARRIMASTLSLAHLEYAVLALGDDEYPDFCAFGRRLDGWLEASGGTRLFDCVEWNGEEDQARRRWAHAIGQLGANSHSADWLPAPYHRWQLAGRELINPGSPGAGAYRVVLAPAQGDALAWEPGDIVEVLPPDPRTGEPTDRPREYSIASLASSGKIELLVRQTVLDNGELGMASGWLTRHGAVGGIIELRLRPNPGFRPPAEPRPMVLIGNGTGLAGLLAHIRHRANNGRSWLLFGERTAAFDRFHGDELDRRLADGTLARADLIFSRDADGGYVQTLVERHAESLRAWIGDGAAIYVCGSLHGMAPAVDAALRAALGNETVDELIRTARYRRDVY